MANLKEHIGVDDDGEWHSIVLSNGNSIDLNIFITTDGILHIEVYKDIFGDTGLVEHDNTEPSIVLYEKYNRGGVQ
jgi:hypothetical protein